MRIFIVMIAALAMPGSASAAWHAANPTVTEAARDPRIAGALAAMDRIDAAILAGDRAGFGGAFTADAVVNNPQNRISLPGMPGARQAAGAIDYSSYDREIDYIAVRPSGEVVAMGDEIVRPRGQAADAGKTVRRRFTDIWRNEAGTWKLALRQATIIKVE